MDLSFDIRGNLKPYKRVPLSIEDFETVFVNSFDEVSPRHDLFRKFQEYTLDFQAHISDEFIQWINGSFISNKRKVNDIDFVNLIDYQLLENKEEQIKQKFIKNKAYKKYGIDAYLLIIYPKGHKLRRWTESDLLYWNDLFTKTRKDRFGKRYSKGYIEVTI